MDQENEQLWEDERNAARKFITATAKIASITRLDDGKDEVFLRMSYKDLVDILASYGVERMCSAVTQAFGEKTNAGE